MADASNFAKGSGGLGKRGPAEAPSRLPGARRIAKGRIRRRYELGTGGVIYVGITLLIALGAFNSGNNLLYWTFGLALSLLLVSGVLSGAMLMGLRVEREWISSACVGETVRVRYRVRNTNRLVPAFALTIEELGFEAEKTPRRRPRRSPSAGTAQAISAPRTFVAHVGAREVVHAEGMGRARRRGAVAFPGIRVRTTFPFGLMRKSLLIMQHGTTVILPRPEEGRGGVLRRASGDSSVGRPSRRAGRGEEFFALREYLHGDSPRDVAWRASARRGSLLVRQFAAPSPERTWIVLRLRTHEGSGEHDERAISIAAGLAEAAEKMGMEYGLSVPLTRLLLHPRRGAGHLSRLMTDLGVLDLGADDGRGARNPFPAHAAGAGASCVVVHAGDVETAFAASAENLVQIGTRDDGRMGAGGEGLERTGSRDIGPVGRSA